MGRHSLEHGVDSKLENINVDISQSQVEILYGERKDTIGADSIEGFLYDRNWPLEDGRVGVDVQVLRYPLNSFPLTCKVARFLLDEGKPLVDLFL